MSGNTFGHLFRVTTFGESHGPGLGVIIDGVPAGLRLDPEQIQHDLDRRRPGQSKVSTMRKEADEVEILSGVMDGVTTGTALAMLIRNTDQRSRDYGNLATCFRPGHADYGYFKKYGIRDYRGGGRSSGRETAMRVAAGSVAKQLLAHYGVTIQAYTLRLGGVDAAKVDLAAVESNIVRSADPDAAEAMIAAIRAAQAEMDSVGGIINAGRTACRPDSANRCSTNSTPSSRTPCSRSAASRGSNSAPASRRPTCAAASTTIRSRRTASQATMPEASSAGFRTETRSSSAPR